MVRKLPLLLITLAVALLSAAAPIASAAPALKVTLTMPRTAAVGATVTATMTVVNGSDAPMIVNGQLLLLDTDVAYGYTTSANFPVLSAFCNVSSCELNVLGTIAPRGEATLTVRVQALRVGTFEARAKAFDPVEVATLRTTRVV